MATKTTTFAVLASLSFALATGCDKSGSASNNPDSGPDSGPDSSGSYADLGISLADLDDEDVSVTSETEHDIHVLAFWATWCVPCTGELAKMQGVHERLGDRGVHFYAISIDGPDTISRVPGYASQEGWTFPVMYDPDTATMTRWNPKGDIPFYVVLDADGNILKTHQGYVKGDVTKLEQFLTEQLPAE